MIGAHTLLRVAVCDDDAKDLAVLTKLVERVMERLKFRFTLASFSSAAELYLKQQDSAFDLLLLDILMDGKNGMEVARQLREAGSRATLIFVTNTPDFALEGYKVNADDYLLKPVTEDTLYAVLKRTCVQHSMILVNSGGVSQPLQLADILYAESAGHYLLIYTNSLPNPIRSRSSLPLLLEQLGEQQFSRCHKGYLVALGQISQINAANILLQNGVSIPLGRKYRESMKEALVQYVEQYLPHGLTEKTPLQP